ncbi:MAG TPA: hypothetical protein VFH78_02865 [Candidatus Thermoplasmatota archaeon]|nr:hypothetical protein [Candidatus Thermoplasmatota archaeon]
MSAKADRSPLEEKPQPVGRTHLFQLPETAGLSAPMQDMMSALLLYKSMFIGPWFEALSREENAEARSAYARITAETREQAVTTVDVLRHWDTIGHENADEVRKQVLDRLLRDMLEMKKSSTEVFLAAGIRSPTEAIRREFLELANIDQRHANLLRAILGVNVSFHDVADPARALKVKGPHIGPFAPGTLSGLVRRAIDDARAAGHEPARLVVSGIVLRHLRDEGAVKPGEGTAFHLPVDIDFSWDGECFAITSLERVSLAEIASSTRVDGGGNEGASSP